MKKKDEIIKRIKKGLIVSCQALEHEPMYTENGGVMPLFAQAAKNAGAVGIRANSVRDIVQIKEKIDLPVIGIIKKVYPPFAQHITVTMKEIDELIEAGSDIVALDCTLRERPDGLTPNEFVSAIKKKYPECLLMADISSLEDGISIDKSEIDFIGTTLSGYTSNEGEVDTPDFQLVKDLVKHTKKPIIAEGRIYFPEQAKKMLEYGAHTVVVGSAITRPQEIAERFIREIKKEN